MNCRDDCYYRICIRNLKKTVSMIIISEIYGGLGVGGATFKTKYLYQENFDKWDVQHWGFGSLF
jgi:hypothetical protein